MHSIAEIKAALSHMPAKEDLAVWRRDERKGVQRLLASYDKRCARMAAEKERLAALMEPERIFWEQGFVHVAGTDEAGRGPLAGPLVTAAVILPHEIDLPGLNDSKKVPPKRREALYDEILQQALAVTVRILGPQEIDTLNIYQAAKQSMQMCLTHLSAAPDAALTDAMPLSLVGIPVKDLVHGDAHSAAIAAASIIAKVTRDRIMVELDQTYPGYGFSSNKGYGSKAHLDALAALGVTPWHRRTYEPIKGLASRLALPPAISEDKLLKLK